MPAAVLDKYLKVAGPIVIAGVRSHTELNGMIGIATRPVFVRGKWLARVKLEGERGSRGVRFENLRKPETVTPTRWAVHEDAAMETDQQASAEGEHRDGSGTQLNDFSVVSFDDCGRRAEVRGDADMHARTGAAITLPD